MLKNKSNKREMMFVLILIEYILKKLKLILITCSNIFQ